MSLIVTKDLELHYELKIVDQKLPLVVFIHGYNTSLTSLRALAISKNACYNSLLLDLPGFGDSKINKVVEFDDFKNGIKLLFQNVALHNFGEIYVVGHSLGGAIAAWVAQNFSFIKRALLATPLTYFYQFDETFASNLKALLLPKTIEEAKKTMDAMLFPKVGDNWDRTLLMTAVIWLKDYFARKDQVTDLVSTVILNKEFLEKKLQRIYQRAAKKLIILGAQFDSFTPPERLMRVSEQLRICFVRIPNSGHAIFFNRVEFFVKIINRFVSSPSCENFQEFIEKESKS